MNRSSTLQGIYDAKKAHLRWVKRAKHLVEGLPVDKEFIPLHPTSCIFGKWLYSKGDILKEISKTSNIMEELEKQHNEIHETYANIYKIFFLLPNNRSFIHKLFTFNSKQISKSEKEKAQIYFKQLRRNSEELIETLDQLEIKINQLEHHELGRLFK
jgi:hypothetical protein